MKFAKFVTPESPIAPRTAYKLYNPGVNTDIGSLSIEN